MWVSSLAGQVNFSMISNPHSSKVKSLTTAALSGELDGQTRRARRSFIRGERNRSLESCVAQRVLRRNKQVQIFKSVGKSVQCNVTSLSAKAPVLVCCEPHGLQFSAIPRRICLHTGSVHGQNLVHREKWLITSLSLPIFQKNTYPVLGVLGAPRYWVGNGRADGHSKPYTAGARFPPFQPPTEAPILARNAFLIPPLATPPL